VKPPVSVDRDEALSLPSTVGTLAGLAYDGVSGRLVLADDSSGTLKVLSEVSGNAANLVSRGWGGPYKTTGIAIDPAHGDLWVVAAASDDGSAPAPSVVHRLQLVSGRLLYSVPAPEAPPEARFVAVALAGTAVYALDAAGHRLFELATTGKTLRPRATIKVDDPASLAVGSDGVAFVAHSAGILRVTLANGQSARVTAARGVDLRGLQSIAHHHDALFGIQRREDGTLAAVRIRLAANGQRATRLDVIGEAAAPAIAIMGNVFYYVGTQAAGGTVVERVKLR
jgi:DNA-binding beta-propeller fold protein YncE